MPSGEFSASEMAALQEISAQLQKIARALGGSNPRSALGFCEAPYPRTIYCNRTQGCLWYFVEDGKAVPIHSPALRCLIRDIQAVERERRKEKTWKLNVRVDAGESQYVLEAGLESVFSESMIRSIASMSVAQLQRPVYIIPQPADTAEVLFLRLLYEDESGAVHRVYADEAMRVLPIREAFMLAAERVSAANGEPVSQPAPSTADADFVW